MADTKKHTNIYCALTAAQADMGSVKKGSVNPAFKSKYADLADVVEAVSVPLNDNGICFFHKIVVVGEDRMMRTVLAHGDSDTLIECDVPLIVDKNNMQGMKSATTYAKRIGLESVTGVAPDDDDGNAAVQSAPVRYQQEAPQQTSTKAASRGLYTALQNGLRNQQGSDALKAWGKANADDIRSLPKDWADEIRDEYAKELEGFITMETSEQEHINGNAA